MATSRGKVLKANLFSLCQSLFPTSTVTYGLPALDEPDDIVAIVDAGTSSGERASQAMATLGTNRSREEVIEVGVLISSWRGTNSQQLVTEFVFDAMATLEQSLRDEPTISGACRIAEVMDWQLSETDVEHLTAGRYAELAITIRAKTRI